MQNSHARRSTCLYKQNSRCFVSTWQNKTPQIFSSLIIKSKISFLDDDDEEIGQHDKIVQLPEEILRI